MKRTIREIHKRQRSKLHPSAELFIEAFLYTFFLFAFAHLLIYFALFPTPISTTSDGPIGSIVKIPEFVSDSIPDLVNKVSSPSPDNILPMVVAFLVPMTFSVLSAITATTQKKKEHRLMFAFLTALIIFLQCGLVTGASNVPYFYLYTIICLVASVSLGFLVKYSYAVTTKHKVFLLSAPYILGMLLYTIL